jgi:cyclase
MSHAPEHERLAPPDEAVEVGEGVFAFVQPDGSWWINNTGFVVARTGVISVDSCSTVARTRAYLSAIAGVTSAPVRTLVNTHHHGDHTFGNFCFDGATIVGREGIREALSANGLPTSLPGVWTDVDWGDIELAPPFLTFEDRIKVYADDLECRVAYAGSPAHTTNDSVVWIPEQRILFSGDLLFNGGTPFLLQGSVSGSLQALEGIRELGATTIVPGHGPVCGPEVIDRTEAYLRFLQGVAGPARAAGLTPLEAARDTDLGEFADLLDSERIVGNLHRAYEDLRAAETGSPLGGPIDAAGALTDMVTYNGGRRLTCYA